MKKAYYYILFLLFISSSYVNSQTRLEEWRDHLPFTNAFRVVEADNRIYAATPGGLFFFNKTDNSLNKLTRIQGLSDNDISSVAYSTSLQQLIIAYANGNIDILDKNSIINITDIKAKFNLGEKRINKIYCSGSYAYLSCGFGIVLLNLAKREISDTYYIGDGGAHLEVFDIAMDDHYIYAATQEGLRKALRDDPNLVIYSVWGRITDIPNDTKKFSSVTVFNQQVFAVYASDQPQGDRVYYYNGSAWNELNTGFDGNLYSSLENNQNQLVLTTQYQCFIFNNNLIKTRTIYLGSPRYAILDKDNIVWIADPVSGLVRITESGTTDIFMPNGPPSPKTFSLLASNGRIILLGGGINSSWGNMFYSTEISYFENQKWSTLTTDTAKDPLCAVIDPSNATHIYAGTWGYGLLEIRDKQIIKIFNEKNSSLQSIIPGQPFVRIAGLAFDKDKNLWVTNSGVPNPVSVRKANGDWKSLPYGNQADALQLGKILITRNNIKWIILPRGSGLFAFDEKGTIDNTNDDATRKFGVNDQSGNTISNYVFSMAEDLDGIIWVGTASGPAVFYNPDGVFTNDNFYATQIIIPRKDGSGYGDLLLSTETITAIAIDGANRKWLGTQNSGVFLMSADGLKQIYHFTVDNSPLLSNTITDIAIEPSTGEVFFGTDLGLVSFRSTATTGGDDFGKVYAFPNPVRPDYHGNIVISGLLRDTNVKITDITGNLVFETTSLGGQAIWNGKTLNGVRVATGVYLVFCTNQDGSRTYVTKLLFIH